MWRHLLQFGAAQIGIAGDDVSNEFKYEEIYSILDLKNWQMSDYLLPEKIKNLLIIKKVT